MLQTAGTTRRQPGKRPPKVFLESFGCQMNALDTDMVLEQLTRQGYERVFSPLEADLVLYNTCSVRDHAEHKVLSRLGEMRIHKRTNPNVLVGVIGCMAQRMGHELLKKHRVVDLVVGTHEVEGLPQLIRATRERGGRTIAVAQTMDKHYTMARTISTQRSDVQAHLSVMRGCDRTCTFCIVPAVRGREQHRSLDEIVDEAKRLVDNGTREITLLGQNINAYGVHLYGRRCLHKVLAALDAIEGLSRIRFVTSHPCDVKDDLLEAMRLPKVCAYLHMPAQSGSDRLLRLMRRGYTRAQYMEIVCRARETVPELELSGDMIVGFPTETEDDFLLTCGMLEDVRYQNVFVFKYSPRPATEAAGMSGRIPDGEMKRRNRMLLHIQQEISMRKNQCMIGRTVEVLVEGRSKHDPAKLMGRTHNNYIVCFDGPERWTGRLVHVEITDATPLTLFAKQTDAFFV